jgi:hypothetical protein
MKHFLLVVGLLTIHMIGYTQELPSKPADGYAFPIGSKFTIKLYPADSTKFQYSIIKFEPFKEIIDTWENDSLFKETGEEGTIEFYFCLSTSGDNDREKEKNRKVLLLIKNRTEYSLKYNSDIQVQKNGEFEETSNVGILPGIKGIEMWPYMIHKIRLKGFKIKE